ncbi:MAG: hypothetical protein ACLTSG_07295 [Lachnospiraceae bacterium]
MLNLRPLADARLPVSNLDLVEGKLIRTPDGEALMSLAELATEALYSMEDSRHITAEAAAQIKSSAYLIFSCSHMASGEGPGALQGQGPAPP